MLIALPVLCGSVARALCFVQSNFYSMTCCNSDGFITARLFRGGQASYPGINVRLGGSNYSAVDDSDVGADFAANVSDFKTLLWLSNIESHFLGG